MMFFKTRQNVIAKQVGSELILYDSENKSVHILNATAAKIFQLCDGFNMPEEIARSLKENFSGIEYVRAYEDVKRTLDLLENKNLVFQK